MALMMLPSDSKSLLEQSVIMQYAVAMTCYFNINAVTLVMISFSTSSTDITEPCTGNWLLPTVMDCLQQHIKH